MTLLGPTGLTLNQKGDICHTNIIQMSEVFYEV